MPPAAQFTVSFWIQLLAPIAVIVSTALWMNRGFNRLDRRLERIELRVATVEHQNRALLKAFPPVISTLMLSQLMTPEQGTRLIGTALEAPPIEDLLRRIQPTTNPLSQDELNRLRLYVERLKHRELLTWEEAQDFYRLSDVVSHEYPGNEGSWLLFLIGGIVLGLVIAGPRK